MAKSSDSQPIDDPLYTAERIFKLRFIAAFLGAYAANHFDDFTMSGRRDALDAPPVADAFRLAESTWQKLLESGRPE